MTITVTTQAISFSWPASERARIYLIQPLESGLSHDAPFIHAPGTVHCAWPSLKAAISADIAQPWGGPVIFVVPELTIAPTLVQEVRALWSGTSSNRLLVAGLGHLTATQCDEVEPGAGSTAALWERAAEPQLFANGALVLPGPFLEAKNSPSKWEREKGCHRPYARLRIFQGESFCFVVLICSEMNDEGARNELLNLLSPYHLDAVFWLQHNPQPRHANFQPLIDGILDRHSKALIICANKAPREGHRNEYGVSGFLLRADRMETDKRSLARPNLAVEGVTNSVTRAILPQYAAAVHCVETIGPGAIATTATDAARNRLLGTIRPFDVLNGQLAARADGAHVGELVAAGQFGAVTRSHLDVAAVTAIAPRQDAIVRSFSQSANGLALFLDHAFRQPRPGNPHDAFHSHTPAAACRCWTHRENLDSLYGPDRRAAVSELVLALAALPSGSAEFSRRSNVSLTVGGQTRSLLLVWGEDKNSEAFENDYWGPSRKELVPTPAVVLDCRANPLAGVDASRPAPRERDAGSSVEPELKRLYGDQFWASIRNGAIEEALGELFL